MIGAGLSMGAALALSVHLVARGGADDDASRPLPWARTHVRGTIASTRPSAGSATGNSCVQRRLVAREECHAAVLVHSPRRSLRREGPPGAPVETVETRGGSRIDQGRTWYAARPEWKINPTSKRRAAD